MYDTLSDVKQDKSYTQVCLENEYIKVCVLPELGGRIFEALDKTNGYNFFYKQSHVLCVDTTCLLYTSDAADDMQCVDLGGRRIIKKKKQQRLRIALTLQRHRKISIHDMTLRTQESEYTY
eukprot:TRINITY_DN37468_c0_g1_i2.p2 TRINITY_DN37468_c0_g1~~TRINITY_DN37468_c0_g1_i2.p2  ORF type:complete len:121 (+),score=17.56 TRINITY_DN37468_c0_g1_i2:198-560(+)